MRDTKVTHELHDGTLRIHRRRPGICQPKDSLGLSCILQANDAEKNQSSSSRRKTLTVPNDNIGISCLPAKKSNSFHDMTLLDVSTPEDTKNVTLNSCQNKTMKTDEYNMTRLRGSANWSSMLTSEIGKLNSDMRKHVKGRKKEVHDMMSDIGISNIRRPKSDKTKPRKPILPKDNIGLCCRLLQKPTILKASISNMEKKIFETNERQQRVKQSQSTPNLKGKQRNATNSKI